MEARLTFAECLDTFGRRALSTGRDKQPKKPVFIVMLMEFTFRNWKSFRDETTFSMIASDSERHDERVSRLKKFSMRVLPISAIYGGNAAGKTNFFEALNFARSFIVSPHSEFMATSPFELDGQSPQVPTLFSFTILVNERVFRYSFEILGSSVTSETLEEITQDGVHSFYSRSRNGRVKVDKRTPEKERSILELIASSTPANRLFLTTTVFLDRIVYMKVYDWFKNSIRLISPTDSAIAKNAFHLSPSFIPDRLSEVVSRLDTGIARIRFEKVQSDESDWPRSKMADLDRRLNSAQECALFSVENDGQTSIFHAVRHSTGIECFKWKFLHKEGDEGDALIDFSEESAGTRRLIEVLPFLIPVFFAKSTSVLVIDEIDRSMHTYLSQRIVTTFLKVCEARTRSQLIFTTHDLGLMSRKLLRRDELWLTERLGDESSRMRSVHDYFEAEPDEDFRSRYLDGRYGGIPVYLADDEDSHAVGTRND